MDAFGNGLTSVARLKATERLSRVYVPSLALSNSYLGKDLCTRKKEKLHSNNNTPLISRTLFVNLVMALHNTLTFHQWLVREKGKYCKMDFVENCRNGEYKSSLHINKNFLEEFK